MIHARGPHADTMKGGAGMGEGTAGDFVIIYSRRGKENVAMVSRRIALEVRNHMSFLSP